MKKEMSGSSREFAVAPVLAAALLPALLLVGSAAFAANAERSELREPAALATADTTIVPVISTGEMKIGWNEFRDSGGEHGFVAPQHRYVFVKGKLVNVDFTDSVRSADLPMSAAESRQNAIDYRNAQSD